MVNRKQEAALKLKKNAVNMKAKNKTGKAMDARLKINAIARKKTLSTLKASGDARDVLAHKMKQVGDARAILEKSRNLKKGINEIKTSKMITDFVRCVLQFDLRGYKMLDKPHKVCGQAQTHSLESRSILFMCRCSSNAVGGAS